MHRIISVILEEVFPFIAFEKNKRKKLNQLSSTVAPQERTAQYSNLAVGILTRRLSEEHDRATKIDEKTAKFTLGLSLSLAILSTASGTLAKMLPSNNVSLLIILLCWLSSVFMLIAGIISLGALKTLPKYGYGTLHEILKEEGGSNHLANVLILQEEINIVRQLRNEAAYQCIRNGFFLLLASLVISIFLIIIPVGVKHKTNISGYHAVIERRIEQPANFSNH